MSTVFDELEKNIISEKLAGDNDSPVSEGINPVMLDSLDRMNRTSVNRSYREIPADGIKGKVTRLFKRLMRRLTFWYVEPCMLQQTDYNGANNIFSAEVNREINELRNKFSSIDEERNSLRAEIDMLKNKLSEHDEFIEILESCPLSQEESKEANISFSQTGEDSIIRYIFSELGISSEKCRYLDIGANHALHLSNTYSFYRQGASGVLVEADPALADELRTARSRDVVINKCISENSGEKIDFYILSGDGLSTADRDSAEKALAENNSLSIVKKISAETISLPDIIREYFPEKAPDIMNLDIEGKDIEILRSMDFEKFRPAVIICEMISYKKGLTVGEKDNEILSLMDKNGYEEFAFTGINSIFIDSRFRR